MPPRRPPVPDAAQDRVNAAFAMQGGQPVGQAEEQEDQLLDRLDSVVQEAGQIVEQLKGVQDQENKVPESPQPTEDEDTGSPSAQGMA